MGIKNNKGRGAKKLLKFRQHLKMDQTEFGVKIGVAQPTVSSYELCKRSPRGPTARKIIKLAKRRKYKLTFDDLYD